MPAESAPQVHDAYVDQDHVERRVVGQEGARLKGIGMHKAHCLAPRRALALKHPWEESFFCDLEHARVQLNGHELCDGPTLGAAEQVSGHGATAEPKQQYAMVLAPSNSGRGELHHRGGMSDGPPTLLIKHRAKGPNNAARRFHFRVSVTFARVLEHEHVLVTVEGGQRLDDECIVLPDARHLAKRA